MTRPGKPIPRPFRFASMISSAVVLGILAIGTACASEDVLVADFEGTDFHDWKATGEAFGK